MSGDIGLLRSDPEMFNLANVKVSLWIKPDTVKGRHGLIAKRFVGTAAPHLLSLWNGGLEFEAMT